MIVRIEGVLEEIQGCVALVRPEGGLTYQVHLPAHSAAQLGASVGKAVSLHTLHYYESQNQGATLTPRLAGFLCVEDRQFFELFTTCKGIGNRKALRAMALDTATIAAAIADRDIKLLQSLPEIGRRMAETLVATLSGKVEPFVATTTYRTPAGETAAVGQAAGGSSLARQALEVLLQLGENRTQAIAWIDQALRDSDDRPGDVQELIARVYRLKAGA